MNWSNLADCGHQRSAIVASFCENDDCYNNRRVNSGARRPRVEAELASSPPAEIVYDDVSIWVPLAGAFATGALAGAVLVMVLAR